MKNFQRTLTAWWQKATQVVGKKAREWRPDQCRSSAKARLHSENSGKLRGVKRENGIDLAKESGFSEVNSENIELLALNSEETTP